MHNVWLTAKREYLERIRSRAFRISTVVIPLVFGIIFGIGALSGRLANGPKHIVVASNDPLLAESAAAEMIAQRDRDRSDSQGGDSSGRPQMKVEVKVIKSADDLQVLIRRVGAEQLDGYLWLNVKPGATRPEATYASGGSADVFGSSRMQNAIGHALVREELEKRGVTKAGLEGLLNSVDLKTVRIKDGKVSPSDAGKSFAGAYAMAFLLYFTLVFYGINVAQSVAADKTSRVFEVLLASVEPRTILAGKLLGVGSAGLTQLFIWVGCLLFFNATSLAASLIVGGLAAYGVTPLQLIFFVIYFLLGFFLYSAMSAGLGATVSQESEVQQFSIVIILPLVVAISLIVYILGNPSAWQVVLLSLLPPLTPIVMCLRMSAMTVPWWQLALSLVLMAASIYGMLSLASRIYRIGILMYGKRPDLPEMIRWLRYS
jgi:ABC-2 type transport system permease protein